MGNFSDKLAESLGLLRNLQDSGIIAVRARDLTRTHRERLLNNGFLQPIMKGWYIPSRPKDGTGDSTAWYASFWAFCAAYLKYRFGTDWCLSPEQSLFLHAGNRSVPRQLLISSPKARNKVTPLPHGTSLFDTRYSLPETRDVEEKEGLRLFTLPSALVACSPRYFANNPTEARIALSMIRDGSDILHRLLDGGRSTIAGRLAGAFRNIGRDRIADDVVKTMRKTGYDVREKDPFKDITPLHLSTRIPSPHVNRIRLMWREMRDSIIKRFPQAPGLPKDIVAYRKRVEVFF